MTQRKARRVILQLLFQYDIHPDSVFEDSLELFPPEFLKGVDFSFVKGCVYGLLGKTDLVDEIINRHAVGWRVDRMGVVDRNIIRFSVYEVIIERRVPVSISVNEAVELAKLFGDEKSSSFVNGVLSKIFKEEGMVSSEQ